MVTTTFYSLDGLLMGGVILSSSKGGEDGIVSGFEIAGMELQGTGLVVLSACSTGMGHVKSGDTEGLVQAFLIAGAERVVATRLSAGGVADEWVTQLLRQGDSMVFKTHSQMKLQMKREALQKLNRQANELGKGSATATKK